MFTAVIRELQKKADEEYEAKVRALLGHYGVESPDQLDEAQKAEFFEHLDASHISDEEELGIDSESLEEGKVASLAGETLLLGAPLVGAGMLAGGMAGDHAARATNASPYESPESQWAGFRGAVSPLSWGGGIGGAGLGLASGLRLADMVPRRFEGAAMLAPAVAGALGGGALGGHITEKVYQGAKPILHEATKQSSETSVWQEASDIIEKIANQPPPPPAPVPATPAAQTAGQQQSQIAGKFSHPSWKLRAKKVQKVYDPTQTVSDQMMENRTLK